MKEYLIKEFKRVTRLHDDAIANDSDKLETYYNGQLYTLTRVYHELTGNLIDHDAFGVPHNITE